MKINSVQGTSFGAITYRPGSQKYVKEYLTQRDRSILNSAKGALSRCKEWDLEVTAKGFRIASKKTADAILVEESELTRVPQDSNLEMKAIYDGYSDTCESGEYCKFRLKLPSYPEAMAQYAKYQTMPLVEKAVDLVKRFEKQDIEFNYEKSLKRKIWDLFFE